MALLLYSLASRMTRIVNSSFFKSRYSLLRMNLESINVFSGACHSIVKYLYIGDKIREENDMAAAISFYCRHFKFEEVMHPAPAFAMLELGDLRLVLSKPNPSAGGGQPMPDGSQQTPGGWNRFAIQVKDLSAVVAELRKAGGHFRNDIVSGVGGRQIIVDDPSGNPVELFEPTIAEAGLRSG